MAYRQSADSWSYGAFVDGTQYNSNSGISDGNQFPALTEYSFTFVGTGSDTLSFGSTLSSGGGYYDVTGISVTSDGSASPSSVVPEPPSVTLLGLGLAALLAATLFRKFGHSRDAAAPMTSGSMLA